MSIRMIAMDLYRVMREVEALEKELEEAPFEKRNEISERLRKAKAEKSQMLRALEGRKDQPSGKKRRF